MKLSRKYNQVNLLISLAVLIITGIVYYFVINIILQNKLDKDLLVEEREIVQYANKYNQLPLSSNYIDEEINYQKTALRKPGKRYFANAQIINPKENEIEPARRLTTFIAVNNQIYRVTIVRSKVESEDLLHIILLITLAITGILLITSAFINKLLLNKLWQPFYRLLQQLKDFNLSNSNTLIAEQTNILEFKELGNSASEMALRVNRDYKELKDFTDTASHEMNTPIAVVVSKLDLLLQTNPLSVEQGILLNDIYDSLARLSKLNQNLLLLTKIENNLMPDAQLIKLDEVLDAKVRHFEGLLNRENILLEKDIKPKELVMSKFLLDILLNNLLNNAIKHNQSGGSAKVSLNSSSLLIANSGEDREIPENYFNKFGKSQKSEGLGLGLALIKQICALYHFDFLYHFENNLHIITIKFLK